MKDAHSISTRRAYGVQRVCRVWHRARSSVYARRQATTSRAPCRRRGPVGAAPDDVLAGHIRRLLEASPFHGEGYRKAWAKLRVAGIRTSLERVRRLMREHDLQAPHRVGHAHGPKAHDGTITTAAPDVMWGTDMTATVTVGEGAAFVFVAVDHCTTECIGLHAAKRGTRFEALEPIRQGVRARFGTIGEGVARGLRLRHDHGSNYLPDDFQQEVAFFGIESSPSFVREPEGNGVAERFIRTLKENLLWVRSFDTIEELRLALLEFKRTYNEQWMLEKYHYQSPAQVRRDFVGLKRPRFSWTRIKGESNVQGGGGNGSVEGRGTGRGIGTDGGSPEGDWSPCRRRGGRGGLPGGAGSSGGAPAGNAIVVLRLLRGESLEALSREAGVEIYRLDAWRERAMAGLELGLKDRHGDPVAEVLDAAKRHIGELSISDRAAPRSGNRAAEQRLPLAMRRSRR